MGCDIHVFAEAKMGRKWVPVKLGSEFYWGGRDMVETVSHPSNTYNFFQIHNMHRDYTLFTVLAGVRGSEEPMKEPVGMPKDIDPALYKELDNPDMHTHTWYEAQELIDLWDSGGGYDTYCSIMRGYTDEQGKPIRKVSDPPLIKLARSVLRDYPGGRMRFIICFDN